MPQRQHTVKGTNKWPTQRRNDGGAREVRAVKNVVEGVVGEVGVGGMYGLLQIIRREVQPFTVIAKDSTQLLCLPRVYFTDADFAGVRRSRLSLSKASPAETTIGVSTASTPTSRRLAAPVPEVVVTQTCSGWVEYHFGDSTALHNLAGLTLLLSFSLSPCASAA
jgi:hypothetical protein